MNKVRKGKRFEYAVRDYLRAKGYTVFMMSASRPFDLIVFAGERDNGCAIECKTTGSLEAAARHVRMAVAGTSLASIVAMKRAHRIEFFEVTSNGIFLTTIIDVTKEASTDGTKRDSKDQSGEDYEHDSGVGGCAEGEPPDYE